MLRRAAVLGDEFPEDLLLQMFRDVAPERSGTELLAGLSGLIVPTGHQLRFRHPILREVAYAGLPYKRRRELHAKAAEVLEATTAAGPPPRAPRTSLLRGPQLRQSDGLRLAGRGAGNGTLCAGGRRRRLPKGGTGLTSSGVSPSERSFYLEALGDAEFLAGRPTEAAAAYLEALRGVRGQALREAHLALKLTR